MFRSQRNCAPCAQRLAASMEDSQASWSSMSAPCGSAQRLAASMEDSPASSANWITRPKWCSTPCGINGRFTRALVLISLASLRVLNALRHQWKIHPADAVTSRRLTPVLNALRHQWKIHPPLHSIGSGNATGAQRLAASMEDSQLVAVVALVAFVGAQRLAASMEDSPSV